MRLCIALNEDIVVLSCIPRKNTNKCNKHGYVYISHS